jgi:DNA primase
MRSIPSTARPISDSEISGEAGDFAAPFGVGKEFYQDLIGLANSVPIQRVFKHYNIRLDEHRLKVTCPFKSHKGGRENTPSFWYYPHTNSYFCFGCRVGNRACDFVAEMDGCNKVKAAQKILTLFGTEADADNVLDRQDFSERLEIMMDFSNTVREFRQTLAHTDAHTFIEDKCRIYDTLNARHKNLGNDALRELVRQLKEEITSYTICPTP